MAPVSFREVRPAALSERARKAFQLANQEAHRLNHCAVGVEHLLIGLAKESLSPAAGLLREHGFDRQWLRERLQNYYPPGTGEAAVPGALSYTLDLRAVLEETVAAGESCGVLPLTPEYLLAALLDQPRGLIPKMLGERKAPLRRLCRRLRRLANQGR